MASLLDRFRKSAPATRDGTLLQDEGSSPPVIRQDHKPKPYDPQARTNQIVDASTGVPNRYMAFTPQLAKAYAINPTNQSQRAAIAQRMSMMYDPRNSPSRSQIQEAYTDPIQDFKSGNTWNADSGLSSKGARLRQPSTKAASPFVSAPILVRMPWDQ